MQLVFIGLIYLWLSKLSVARDVLRLETDYIIRSSSKSYLIQSNINYSPVRHDSLYVCPRRERRISGSDVYECHVDKSLVWIRPYRVLWGVWETAPDSTYCPYLKVTRPHNGIVRMDGHCLSFCFLCFCILERETVAVVKKSDLEPVDVPKKDDGCCHGKDDRNGFDKEAEEGDESNTEKPGQGESTIDDALLVPEETTPRPDKEPEYFEEPGIRGPPTQSEKLVAEQSRRFTLNLLKSMRDEHKGENLVASPTAILAVLKIFLEGAEGSTLLQLKDVIGRPYNIQRFNMKSETSSFLEMNTALMYDDHYRMFEDKERKLNDQGVHTEALSIDDKSVQAKDRLNKWISDRSNKTMEPFKPDDLIGTELVILNTLTFTGKFEKPFVEDSLEDFTTLDGSTHEIYMMSSREGEAYQTMYSTKVDAQVVDIPYKNSELKLRLIIPGFNVTLDEVEDNLSPEVLEDIDSNIKTRNITLKIPKVVYNMDTPMEEVLQQMGFYGLFRGANLQGLFEDRYGYDEYYYKEESFDPTHKVDAIRIGNFFHSVAINITEEGTTAASNSIGVSNLLGGDEIVANRPFLLFIEDDISHQILFFARIGH